VDEADACISEHPELAAQLLKAPVGCARLLVGATVPPALVSSAVGAGWLRAPQECDGEGGVSGGDGDEAGEGGTNDATRFVMIPRSVEHRAAVADSEGTRLTLLVRMIRDDVRTWEAESAPTDTPTPTDTPDGTPSAPRPRAVVFVQDEEAAARVSGALRSALWGIHALAVLLPTQGADPTLVTSNFRRAAGADGGFGAIARAQSASVLVAPAASARGLDFANVSHVFALGVALSGAAEYAHMAGRTGRVGQGARAVMTSVLGSVDEVETLRGIVEEELGRTLLVGAAAVPDAVLDASSGGDADDLKRRLEDALLLETSDSQEDDGGGAEGKE